MLSSIVAAATFLSRLLAENQYRYTVKGSPTIWAGMKIYAYTVYNTAWHLKDMLCISNLAAQEGNQDPHEIYIIFFCFHSKANISEHIDICNRISSF